MNAFNEVGLRSWFMALFFGSTLLYAALAGRWLLFAAGFYVVGMFLWTALFNVPLNNRPADAGSDKAKAETWTHYVKHWTRWN